MSTFGKCVVALLSGQTELAEDMFYDFMVAKQRTVSSDVMSSTLKPLVDAADFSAIQEIESSLKSPWEYRGGTGPVDKFNAIMKKYNLPLKLISISPNKKEGGWLWEIDGINKPIEDREDFIPMFENDDLKDGVTTDGEQAKQETHSPVPEFDEESIDVKDVPEHPNSEVNGFDLEPIKFETDKKSQ